ncbi:class I SAM-dependent methyltransferase, partial [candidate division KSB1 bacterium]|nr:class I SAM-dependent methyltransferase [candidate division KSB1 bacterium]
NLEPYIHSFAQFDRYKSKKVLEVGVGAGTDFINWLRNGALASGIDLTDEAIENVKQRLNIESLNAEKLEKADAENLPFDNNLFDLVYSWGVIHHTPDTVKALNEIVRVTKPGGEIKIMIYHRHSITAFWVWVRNCLLKGKFWQSISYAVANYVESPGTKAYTKAEAEKLFSSIPVKIVDLNTVLTWCDLAKTSRSGFVRFIHSALSRIGGGDRVGWFMLIKAIKK